MSKEIPPPKKRSRSRHGAVDDIYRMYIEPLLDICPSNMFEADWLDLLFGVPQGRTIKQFKAVTSFKLPGQQYLTANRPVPPFGHRTVSVGTRVWVREDPRQNFIDVDLNIGQGGKEAQYRLSEDQWISIQKNLKPC